MIEFNGKGKNVIDGLLNLPLVLPPTVVGFFLLVLLGKRGPIGKVLGLIDLSVIFTWQATVIASATVAFPLVYKTVKSSLEQVDVHCINAAKTLGISNWRIFINIMLPQAWNGIVAGIILAFARAIGEFGATLMIAGNIPGKTQTMSTAIFFAAENGDMDRAFMWVMMIVIISLGATVAMNRWLSRQQKYRQRDEVKNGITNRHKEEDRQLYPRYQVNA